ncbi:MAG: bifunctional hydroxymethylpyrimidine kinase/phosphomethylpyrimidine kinase [Cytophagaceae bacterium]|nr:bifunctional hydroxymethylpyrimidine kinase/phosphomethylpyrimidine kinase [Cytophagaceae bacterium]MBK9933520.1 bifunctional hydroxymethylpyrimidine kinase/phosphomethylpyrimidine kinase [Cytophagaceae bacterium]MBL0302766.1 bifunctional hydroxymethylpyrimidine kinase/phosphomethylpyrimidine kinase [Cytophagaceae bacterium]MBL0325587.1 bifunctional hydroxymethylpyrimidine kinase/phosphomethylpyrimidine kinase [Cytophagaceae bacterium]
MSLLTVGSVAFDKLETPFGKTDKIVGGAATFIALTASYFTSKNNIVGIVGSDFPKEMIKTFNEHGINTDGLEIDPEGKTFFWHGKYHQDMNNRDTLDTQLGVFENWEPTIPEEYQDTQYLMLGNMVPVIQHQTLKKLRNRPKFVMLDTMNLWMDIAMDDLKKVLLDIDCLTINDAEARQLSGDYSLKRAAKTIMKMGPKTLIIKKGEHGALLFQDDRIFYCPALPLEEVFDPTGAGDTFAGGFIGYLAKTDDLSFENMKRAIIYGSAMASFCVEKFGTERIQYLTQTEINNRVMEFVQLASFEIID